MVRSEKRQCSVPVVFLAHRLRPPVSIVTPSWLLVAGALGLGACGEDDTPSTSGAATSTGGGGSAAVEPSTGGGSSGTAGLADTRSDSPAGGGSGTSLGGSQSSGGAAGATAGGSSATAGTNSGVLAGTGGTAPTSGGAGGGTGAVAPTDGGGDGVVSSAGGGANTGGAQALASGGSEVSPLGGNGSSAGGASGSAGSLAGSGGHSAGDGDSGGTEPSDGGSAGSAGSVPWSAAGQPQISSDAVPSIGCDAAALPSAGRHTIDVEGTEREYILRLPEDYDASRPYPLIFAWHGGQYSAEWVDTGGSPQSGPYYGVLDEANGNAIFVAPQAMTGSWRNENGRDIAFVDAMLDVFENELCIDLSRIFATGFSMGGIMTLTIGCERADVFRAIAPMSGSLADGCPDGELPIAYWGSHGTSDTTISPAQGEAARDVFVGLNQCDETSTPVDPSGCVSFDACAAGYPVVFCTFDGVHEPAPFAGEEIWRFFSQF